MTAADVLRALHDEMREELTERILPFWMGRAVDARHGGFVGAMDADGIAHPDAPRGGILYARILWTFAAAYRALGDPAYREAADRALHWMRAHLLDPEHGGMHWMAAADGSPLDTRKHVYAQAFAIYALAEHHRATGDPATLREAVALWERVERHAHDPVHGGYHEAFSREWRLLDDARLSEQDADERRSMNTHLHLLEAYTTLLRAWPEPRVAARLRELLELFLEHVVAPDGRHVRPFFDDRWAPRSEAVSYGHDIETSWLLLEAADALGDPALRGRVRAASLGIARAVLQEALDPEHGGIFYELRPGGEVETDKEWWPQAEAVVGFVNAFQETGDAEFLDAAWRCWRFTVRHLVDRAGGEWHRRTTRDGEPRPGMEKVGPWKCPYHNARACLEIMARAHAPALAGG